MANSTRHQWGRKSRNTNPRTQQVDFYKIQMQIQIEIQIEIINGCGGGKRKQNHFDR